MTLFVNQHSTAADLHESTFDRWRSSLIDIRQMPLFTIRQMPLFTIRHSYRCRTSRIDIQQMPQFMNRHSTDAACHESTFDRCRNSQIGIRQMPQFTNRHAIDVAQNAIHSNEKISGYRKLHKIQITNDLFARWQSSLKLLVNTKKNIR